MLDRSDIVFHDHRAPAHRNKPREERSVTHEHLDRCIATPRTYAVYVTPYIPGSDGCVAHEQLQHRVFRHHGVDCARRTADTCMTSCSHLILARAGDGALHGGLRLHQRAHGRLPVEAALPRSPEVQRLLDHLPPVAELSGAVVSLDARKTGLSAALMRIAVAVLPRLGCRAAVGFGHQHVLPLYARFGLLPEPGAPVHPYPDSRYRSRVIALEDALALQHADPIERVRIHALRQRGHRRGHPVHLAVADLSRGGSR